MQWRTLARRGRTASWTVVGDAAQASWSDLAEAGRARDEAFSGQERRGVPHGHQLPQRPRDLRLRARRHPAARARRRHPGCRARDRSRPRRPRRRGTSGGRPPRPMPSTSCSARSRARSRSSRRGAGPSGWPGSTVPATVGCRSSTRCRPRAWSGTRRSSSTRRDRRGVTRRGARALRRADPRGAPDARAAPRLTRPQRTCPSAARGFGLRSAAHPRRCGMPPPADHACVGRNRCGQSPRAPSGSGLAQSSSGKRWMISCRPGPTPIAETRAPISSSTRST